MGDTAQRAFNPAQNNWHIGIGFTAALAINHSRTVGAFVGGIVWRVGIVTANASIGGIAVNHAVHIACGDAPRDGRFAKCHKSIFARPIWLGDDTDAKALRL